MDFEEIYSLYFSDVYKYIRRLSNDEHIAEEITSETFFKALRTIDSFRGECDLRVWLCQIAKNSYYTYLKKHAKYKPIDELCSENTSFDSLEERFENKTEAQFVREALHDIAEPYKEVFMWRVFGELSFKQIGGIFGKTDNWACVTYHRAKLMIIERIERADDDK